MQERRVAVDFHFRHGSLFQLRPGFASGFTNAAPQELAEIWIVPDNHDRFLLGIFLDQSAKIGEGSAGPERILKLQLAFIAEFIAHQ